MISAIEIPVLTNEPESENEQIVFNGINARTGDYLFPPLPVSNVSKMFRRKKDNRKRALMPGIDPRELAETGWGVVFHADEDPEIREALSPLLEHRRQQGAGLFREFSGKEDGYRGEEKEDFLVARGADIG